MTLCDMAPGERIKARREELRLSRADVERLCGVSVSNLKTIEDGGRMSRGEWVEQTPRPQTLLAIDTALQWGNGSTEAVLSGGEPVEAPQGQSSETEMERVLRLLEELTELVVSRLPDDRRSP